MTGTAPQAERRPPRTVRDPPSVSGKLYDLLPIWHRTQEVDPPYPFDYPRNRGLNAQLSGLDIL